MKRHLIVYAKRPLPGYAKTRLGQEIGDENAAGVYARMLYTCLLNLAQGCPAEMTVELSLSSAQDVPFFSTAFPEFVVCSQVQGDLGRRMAASFARAFDRGARAAVLIGSDIPGLNADVVRSAFRALKRAQVVLGPAADGGYYLIGMRAPGVPLFDDIAWSTDRVLAQTQALARAHQVRVAMLPGMADIDTADDFFRWQKATT